MAQFKGAVTIHDVARAAGVSVSRGMTEVVQKEKRLYGSSGIRVVVNSCGVQSK